MQNWRFYPPRRSNLTKNFGTGFSVRLEILRRYVMPLLTRHATYIVMGVSILLLDLLTSPLLMFPILFVLPVVLSAWFCSPRLAYGLAVLLPLSRAVIATFADLAPSVAATAANALIRIAVLSLLTFLIAQVARQTRELKVLRGRLPICMWCKRIRNEVGSWERLETYIAAHSEADFTHGLCPECTQEHYGDLFDKKQNPSAAANPPVRAPSVPASDRIGSTRRVESNGGA